MDEGLSTLITRGAAAGQIASAALAAGMIPLLEDGLDKAVQGVTTVEEVLRVAQDVHAIPV